MNKKPSVVLISVDALKPEFIYEGNRLGVELENINKYFTQGGTFASKGMKSVLPPFTYACHQSMITGTHPAKHGAYGNGMFDPTGELKGAWHWFVKKHVENLWELAGKNGYTVASMAFPTSVMAKGDFIAPEFWYCGGNIDRMFIDAMAHPQGLITEMERAIRYYPTGLQLTPKDDEKRLLGTLWLLEKKIKPITDKPFFLSTYFASFDETAHNYGVYSREAAEQAMVLDDYVGKIIEKAKEIAGEDLVVCLVSDHGTLDNTHNIFPNVILKENGLITGENGKVTDWQAWSQRSGGTAEVRLKNKKDSELKMRVFGILQGLANDPESGVAKIISGEEARARGGFAESDFVIIAKRGYEIRDDFDCEYITTKRTQTAQHGYDNEYEEMRASFGIWGSGIAQNKDIEKISLVDVAPTLAAIMGFEMQDAQGENALKK